MRKRDRDPLSERTCSRCKRYASSLAFCVAAKCYAAGLAPGLCLGCHQLHCMTEHAGPPDSYHDPEVDYAWNGRFRPE